MLLQPHRMCFLLQAVSMIFGLSGALEPSSLPSPSTSTLKHGLATTLGYGFDATTSSLFFNVSSITDSLALNSTVPASNISSFKALTDDDDGSSIAKNVGGNVNIYGPGSINVTLDHGKLTFGYCIDCVGKVLICFDSDTVISPTSDDNPRNLCGSSGQCGFQIEVKNDQAVYAMGHKIGAPRDSWYIIHGQCPVTTMTGSEIKMLNLFQSCAPRIVNGVVTLNIKSVMENCPLKIVDAKLKPAEVSTTPAQKESTTEESSSATTIWIVLGSVIFGFALLGLVAFAIWFFKFRHRKSKPAKTEPEPTEVAAPTDKVQQLQVQVKDEIKKDSVAVGKKAAVPPKSESKVAAETPAKPKVDEPAKVKIEEAPEDKLKTTEDTVADSTVLDKIAEPPIDPTVKNENLQARAKSAIKPLSLRSVKSTKSGQKKPDSALLSLQASNEYRKLEPIHSLNRVYGIYAQKAKDTAQLYPPGRKYSDEMVKALLLDPVGVALKAFDQLSVDARKTLVDHGVEFDYNDNTTKISRFARRMVREDDTEEHVKAYLFLAEYGKDFDPTPDILCKFSAPLLFIIALGVRYSDQLREAAIIEMRRHLPIIRKCWSNEERRLCHFPLNGIQQAYRLNKRAFRKNAGLNSESSSDRKVPRDPSSEVAKKT